MNDQEPRSLSFSRRLRSIHLSLVNETHGESVAPRSTPAAASRCPASSRNARIRPRGVSQRRPAVSGLAFHCVSEAKRLTHRGQFPVRYRPIATTRAATAHRAPFPLTVQTHERTRTHSRRPRAYTRTRTRRRHVVGRQARALTARRDALRHFTRGHTHVQASGTLAACPTAFLPSRARPTVRPSEISDRTVRFYFQNG
ncbi:hypothetical protein PUN28_009018 [Cardiocondyla obscurior]|uniref:Uncharacterized protein n=1 Tax=Cardiocondyla obscurior TaxID=286306 RepID=A0AAW2FS52_9HYME